MTFLDFLWTVAQALDMCWIALFKIGKSEPCSVPAKPITESPLHDEAEKVRAVYAALAAKRATYDLMLWQAPMISLTAQAFLLNIALGDGKLIGPKIVSGIAATVIGLASWQLFNRHSAMERQASDKLEKIEEKYNFPEKAHHCPARENRILADTPGKSVWSPCLLLLSFVGLVPLLEPWLRNVFPGCW